MQVQCDALLRLLHIKDRSDILEGHISYPLLPTGPAVSTRHTSACSMWLVQHFLRQEARFELQGDKEPLHDRSAFSMSSQAAEVP